MTDKKRFQGKVDLNGPIPSHCPELGPCHVWTGGRRASNGYGAFRMNGKTELAHRAAFYFSHGRWPEPCALHHCDNRSCVNADHLFEGTRADNTADMMAKGRDRHPSGDDHGFRLHPEAVARGERHGCAKLTDQDVRDIRANYLLCRVTQTELGKRFGVSHAQIGFIVRGKSRVTA